MLHMCHPWCPRQSVAEQEGRIAILQADVDAREQQLADLRHTVETAECNARYSTTKMTEKDQQIGEVRTEIYV